EEWWVFFVSSRRRHAILVSDWSSDVCSSDLVIESKEGRHAVLADVVVDASGDGDVYARAGAAYESDVHEGSIHHCVNVAWLFAEIGRASCRERGARAVGAVWL